jgi:integrase
MPKQTHSKPKVCHYNYDMTKQWYVHFRATDPSTGQRKQFRLKMGINYIHTKSDRIAEANDLCRALSGKLKEGWLPFANPDLIDGNLIDTMQHVCKLKWDGLRPRTHHTYKVVIDIFYRWLNSTGYRDLEPKEFEYFHAQQYMDHLSTKQKIQGRTWNNHLAFIKIFFNYLVEREIIDKNPFKQIKKQAQAKSVRNYAFTKSEYEKLCNHLKLKNRWLYCFNMFIYYGALRQKEISMLKIKDIDFSNRNIFINGEVSKNKKAESVVITANFLEIINSMNLHEYPDDYYIFGYGCKPGSQYNNTFDKLSVKTKRIIRKLGINENCTQYSFKHYGIIKLYYATRHNIQAVSQHCRHYSISVTQNYMKSLGFVDNKAVREAVF